MKLAGYFCTVDDVKNFMLTRDQTKKYELWNLEHRNLNNVTVEDSCVAMTPSCIDKCPYDDFMKQLNVLVSTINHDDKGYADYRGDGYWSSRSITVMVSN